MLLKDLIIKYNFEDIFEELVNLYPDQKQNEEGYKNAYKELKELNKVYQKVNENSFITVKKMETDKNFYDSFLVEDEEKLGYEYSPWEEMVNYKCEIDYDMPEKLFLAVVLFELTFAGFSAASVRKEINKLNNYILKN
jgi:hypothetical protein